MVKGEIKFSFDRGGSSGVARVFNDDMVQISKYSWKIEDGEVVVTTPARKAHDFSRGI